ncbi:MAG: hypothetical protein J7L61_02480 [Thermoplasmata archaeon]|nr:hypothetical protein [Thermoplasmata archaeon]
MTPDAETDMGKRRLYRRTTIYLEEDLLKRAKIYCINNHRTLKEIVNESVKEYLDEKESEDLSPFSSRLVDMISEYLPPNISRGILQEKCRQHGLSLRELSRWAVTEEFAQDLLQTVKRLLPPDALLPLTEELGYTEVKA